MEAAGEETIQEQEVEGQEEAGNDMDGWDDFLVYYLRTRSIISSSHSRIRDTPSDRQSHISEGVVFGEGHPDLSVLLGGPEGE